MGIEFQGKLKLKVFLTTLTGLSIGKTKLGTENSSIPKMVVRNAITDEPYIPASSIRGVLRRTLERLLAQEGIFPACKDTKESQKCPICRLFGTQKSNLPSLLPGRVILKDAVLTKETLEYIGPKNKQADLTEIKVYASMDRVTSQGNSYSIEQIPANACFQFEIIYSIYEKEDIELFSTLMKGLQEIENSYIGSNGSRGLGKICFRESSCTSEEVTQGLSLIWFPKSYYIEGKGEKTLIKSEENVNISDLIQEYEKRVASILN